MAGHEGYVPTKWLVAMVRTKLFGQPQVGQPELVLHTFEADPDPHPPVHLTIKAEGLDGIRLKPRKVDIQHEATGKEQTLERLKPTTRRHGQTQHVMRNYEQVMRTLVRSDCGEDR